MQKSLVLKDNPKIMDATESKSLTNDSDAGSHNNASEHDDSVSNTSMRTENIVSSSNVANNKLETKNSENELLGVD